MHSTTLFAALLATATTALANSVTFRSQDSTARTVIFTPSKGYAEIDDLKVAGNAEEKVDFPHGWEGNWYSVSEGSDRSGKGMLGEVAFDGFVGVNFFDVSAIVDPDDHEGVHEIFPLGDEKPVSGCKDFKEECDSVYRQPDDKQTKSTSKADLVCTLGKK